MKEKYMKPEMEAVELNTEGVIAASGPDSSGVNNDDEYTGPSYSKKNFWGD